VLEDLASGRPMDRLVCGDVGFGKTEVALRAAFVAAMAGVQVAVVVPTTLLARQHYTNFVERFKGFPVNIGRLSRLVPASEAQKTRDGLASGQIDIVVGTHAVIAKSVEFQNLGLVIVDEEQRFGVVHKERLKQLKADVHVLTLTATPDSAHFADGDVGAARTQRHPDPAGGSPCRTNLCRPMGSGRDARGAAART
jgi:transcription-repair coupling factor (superfamily II helicase)